MALMNRLNARSVATLEAGKYNDGAGACFFTNVKMEVLNGFIVIPFMVNAVKWDWVP